MIDVTTGIPEDTIKYGVAFHECIDADGNSYKVVKIGDQTWMDENLKTTKFNDGTAIPYTKDNSVWSASVLASTPAYCWYSDDTYQNAYGALYNWYAVNTGKLPLFDDLQAAKPARALAEEVNTAYFHPGGGQEG